MFKVKKPKFNQSKISRPINFTLKATFFNW